jgi:hypothetical protein
VSWQANPAICDLDSQSASACDIWRHSVEHTYLGEITLQEGSTGVRSAPPFAVTSTVVIAWQGDAVDSDEIAVRKNWFGELWLYCLFLIRYICKPTKISSLPTNSRTNRDLADVDWDHHIRGIPCLTRPTVQVTSGCTSEVEQRTTHSAAYGYRAPCLLLYAHQPDDGRSRPNQAWLSTNWNAKSLTHRRGLQHPDYGICCTCFPGRRNLLS